MEEVWEALRQKDTRSLDIAVQTLRGKIIRARSPNNRWRKRWSTRWEYK